MHHVPRGLSCLVRKANPITTQRPCSHGLVLRRGVAAVDRDAPKDKVFSNLC